MTDNVVYPAKFQNSRPRGNPNEVSIGRETVLAVYGSLLTLYYAANNGCLAQGRLVTEMTRNPQGLPPQQTLEAASIVSNNAIMLEKFRDAMKSAMDILKISLYPSLEHAYALQIIPLTHPGTNDHDDPNSAA